MKETKERKPKDEDYQLLETTKQICSKVEQLTRPKKWNQKD
jgi:hypothetical protein